MEPALALGWAVLGRDICVAFRVAGSEMQAVPMLTSLTFVGLLPPSPLGYFLSRVPWSYLSKKKNISKYGKREEVSL